MRKQLVISNFPGEAYLISGTPGIWSLNSLPEEEARAILNYPKRFIQVHGFIKGYLEAEAAPGHELKQTSTTVTLTYDEEDSAFF